MEGTQGLKNLAQNIEPVMHKCREGKKLTKDEQEQVVQFYLEVLHYLSSQ